jgi:hypothetical protein
VKRWIFWQKALVTAAERERVDGEARELVRRAIDYMASHAKKYAW